MTEVKHQRRVIAKSLALISCALLFALGTSADAQQAKKIPRIGILFGGSSSGYSVRVEAFRQRLKELGYIEPKFRSRDFHGDNPCEIDEV